MFFCLNCGRSTDSDKDSLPKGDEKCSHEWECEHMIFSADVAVARMPSKEGGPIERYCADIRIKCHECGLPFRFIGLPAGLDLNGASVSVDACEAHLAIGPKGQVVSVLEGGVVGYSIRNTTERFTAEELREISSLSSGLIAKLQRMIPA